MIFVHTLFKTAQRSN